MFPPPRTEILAAPLSKFNENYTNSLNDYFLYECVFFGKLKESIKHTLRMRTKNANKVISERLFGRDKCGQSVILHEVFVCANEASLRECSHIVHGIQSVSMQMRQHIVESASNELTCRESWNVHNPGSSMVLYWLFLFLPLGPTKADGFDFLLLDVHVLV